MTTYRAVVTDLDHACKLDGWTGYKVLTFCTVLILGQLVYAVQLSF